jgi:hypothetical protein
MKIALDPSTKVTDSLRSYTYIITKRRDKGVWKAGRIEGHAFKKRGLWDLVFRILRNVVGSRNLV